MNSGKRLKKDNLYDDRLPEKLEFARRAGSQVVRQICVVVSALRRSVSFRGAVAGCRLPGHCEPEFQVIAIK